VPKLSILLPTYNGERFLPEQLDSILAQTDPDLELLAIDDGSGDATLDVLRRFAVQDDRIHVIPSEGNSGQNARLIELLGHARGEFIAVADQDDRWAADRNEKLFDALGARTMAFGRSELTDATGTPRGMSLLDTFDIHPRPDDRLLAFIQPLFSAHAMILRRNAVSHEAFFNTLPFDWLIALEALLIDGFAYCDEAVVFHRQHADNQCNNFHNVTLSTSISSSDLRYILLFRQPLRLRMWATFDFLGRSQRIGRTWRTAMRALAIDCHTAWFSEWRTLRLDSAAVRRTIVDTLAPLAGSARDLARFDNHVAILTRPAFSRPVREEVQRRLRLVRAR